MNKRLLKKNRSVKKEYIFVNTFRNNKLYICRKRQILLAKKKNLKKCDIHDFGPIMKDLKNLSDNNRVDFRKKHGDVSIKNHLFLMPCTDVGNRAIVEVLPPFVYERHIIHKKTPDISEFNITVF